MNKIDMHFHSIFSDGKNTHEEILKQAKSKDLDFIALTDHDNISDGFREKAEEYGIKSTRSVEISARNYQHEKSLHLTCYAKSFKDNVYEILEGVKNARKNNLRLQVKSLQNIGINVSIENLEILSKSMGRKIEALNKYDIAKFIYENPENKEKIIKINNGEEIGLIDFYLNYFKREGKNFSTFGVLVPEYEPSLEVCKQIRDTNNAILAIAHPNFTFRNDIKGFINNIEHYIKKGGINAIEINSIASQERIEIIKKIALKYSLFITFGSDNHQIGYSDDKHADFGELNKNITPEFIEKELEKYIHLL